MTAHKQYTHCFPSKPCIPTDKHMSVKVQKLSPTSMSEDQTRSSWWGNYFGNVEESVCLTKMEM